MCRNIYNNIIWTGQITKERIKEKELDSPVQPYRSQIPERTKEFPLQERTQNCSQTEAVHSISQFVSSALAQNLDLDLDRLIQIRINIKRPVHYRKGPDWPGFRSDGQNINSNGALMWTMWTLSLPSFCSLPSQKNPHLMQKSGQKDAKPKFLSPVESWWNPNPPLFLPHRAHSAAAPLLRLKLVFRSCFQLKCSICLVSSKLSFLPSF